MSSDSTSVTDLAVRAGISDGLEKGITPGDVRDVVETHDGRGWNYVWLQPWMGLLLWVEFLEDKEWKHYSRFWWARHGSLVSHDPEKLVNEHMRYYVGAKAPIKLRFYFQTPAGYVYSAEPQKWWYELEASFFRRHALCSKDHDHHHPTPDQVSKYVNDTAKEGLAPHWGPEVLNRPILTPPRWPRRTASKRGSRFSRNKSKK